MSKAALAKQAEALTQGHEEEQGEAKYDFQFLSIEHNAKVVNKKVLLEDSGYSTEVEGKRIYFDGFDATIVRKQVRYVHKGKNGKALARTTFENGYTSAEGFKDTNGGIQLNKKNITDEDKAAMKEKDEKISSEVWIWMNIDFDGVNDKGEDVSVKSHRVQFNREGSTGFDLNKYLSDKVKVDNNYFNKVVYFTKPELIENSIWYRAVYAVGDDAELTQETIDTLQLANEAITKVNAEIIKQHESVAIADDINSDLEED